MSKWSPLAGKKDNLFALMLGKNMINVMCKGERFPIHIGPNLDANIVNNMKQMKSTS